jgi:hypothetical protein
MILTGRKTQMTHATDLRHVTVEGILSTGNLQAARQPAAMDAGWRPILAWFGETDALGRSLWRVPEVHR